MGVRLNNPELLDKLIIKTGHSRRSFAKAIGLGEATIIQICSGKRNPSPGTAKKIIEALQIEWDDIFAIEKISRVAN
ncbi:helix-turn-helix transcriptional regulator [Brevibacillus sp. NRS-1366]|uniref:helix-turn-helix transcriptional regulator n=1 Tax=Brevibacillus sp. NRS-1366 TaxID=3233899 RepID=UPI003D1AF9E3